MTDADMIEAIGIAIDNAFGDILPPSRIHRMATAALAVVQPELDRLRAENEALRRERDEAHAMISAWEGAVGSLEAHLQDRIAMKDEASPETYLAILRADVGMLPRDSRAIYAATQSYASSAMRAAEAANTRAESSEALVAELREKVVDLTHREKVRSEAINKSLTDANERADAAQARADFANKLFDQREEYLSGLDARNAELRAENARLRSALEPFASRAGRYDPDDNDDGEPDWSTAAPSIRIGDLRRARAALSAPARDEEGR